MCLLSAVCVFYGAGTEAIRVDLGLLKALRLR